MWTSILFYTWRILSFYYILYYYMGCLLDGMFVRLYTWVLLYGIFIIWDFYYMDS